MISLAESQSPSTTHNYKFTQPLQPSPSWTEVNINSMMTENWNSFSSSMMCYDTGFQYQNSLMPYPTSMSNPDTEASDQKRPMDNNNHMLKGAPLKVVKGLITFFEPA